MATPQQIIDDARILLKDATKTTWSDDKLLVWVNAGVREIVSVRPDAYPRIVPIETVAGTRQSLPVDGMMLLHVPRNIVGTAPGRAIRKAGRDQLDAVNPDWHSDTPSATARNFIYDTATPTVFYLYPPSIAGSKVEVIYTPVPPDTALNGQLPISDGYRNALVDYVLYRAYSEDMEVQGAASRAVAHKQLFDAFLGIKARADVSSAAAQTTGA